MAEEAFELIRRVGGSRIVYQIRTTGGKFKTVPDAGFTEVVDAAERNVPVDIAEGAFTEAEYLEFERGNPFNTAPVEEPPVEGTWEEVPLDELELNTTDFAPTAEAAEEGLGVLSAASETTPLLAGAGSVAAGSGATAGGTGAAVVGGLVVTGGAAIVGGIASTVSGSSDKSEHTDPVVSFPDHHFIGPGNTVSDTKPVDEDDHIAKDHDIAYEKAETQEDIQKADAKSADEFFNDLLENKNPHSAAGYIGLKTKQAVESVIGVQYPANLPSSSHPTGMGRKIRALNKYPIHTDPSRHEDFPKDNKSNQRYVWDAWNRARQNHGLPRVDPPPRLRLGHTFRPPVNSRTGVRPSNKSISYREWKDSRKKTSSGPLIDALSNARDKDVVSMLDKAVAEDLTPDEKMEIDEIVRQIDGGSISLADFDDLDGAGPSGYTGQVEQPPVDTDEEMPSRGSKRPHEGEQGGPAAPPNPALAVSTATADGTGHNSGSDGGFDSAQGPVSFLPTGGYKVTPGSMMFSKVHRMKSWAIPYWNVADASIRGGSNLVTTPLAKIPWEYVFFYMSQEEFDLLPAGSFIDSVHIKIMQTVASTGFPTGSTDATVATTNHPKVLCIGKDLEKKMRGGVDRGLQISNDMVPSLRDQPDSSAIYDDFIAKQYGTDQSAKDNEIVVPGVGHKIPFYNFNHFCIYQPNNAQALAREFFTQSGDPPAIDSNNAPGFEYFQNCITECNANDTTWDMVDSMSYKFENAPIGEQFRQLEIVTDSFNQSTGNARYYNAKRQVTNGTVQGNTTITENYVPSNRDTLPIVTYKSAPIEKGSYYVRGDNAGKPARQPSYHIGMRAIDKASPVDGFARATKFVQANIEFEIQASMLVRLPSYPNRFVKPKFYNTSMENAAMGISAYPAFNSEKFVTFGLLNESSGAPTVSPVDQQDSVPTEDDMVTLPRRQRPRRALPSVPMRVLRKRVEK